MLNNLECLHVSSHICVLHLCWHGKASDINVSISAPQCVGAVQMVCRLLISPKSPKFVTTFRAPLREMKMVTRNVRVVVVGWGVGGGWLPGWLDAITATIWWSWRKLDELRAVCCQWWERWLLCHSFSQFPTHLRGQSIRQRRGFEPQRTLPFVATQQEM